MDHSTADSCVSAVAPEDQTADPDSHLGVFCYYFGLFNENFIRKRKFVSEIENYLQDIAIVLIGPLVLLFVNRKSA